MTCSHKWPDSLICRYPMSRQPCSRHVHTPRSAHDVEQIITIRHLPFSHVCYKEITCLQLLALRGYSRVTRQSLSPAWAQGATLFPAYRCPDPDCQVHEQATAYRTTMCCNGLSILQSSFQPRNNVRQFQLSLQLVLFSFSGNIIWRIRRLAGS